MDKILLVPSATKVPKEMRMDLGPIPMGMIPLQNKIMLEHISANYSGAISDKYVATMENSDRLRYYMSKKNLGWNEIGLRNSNSLAETIIKSLENIEKERDLSKTFLYINFADTLVEPVGKDFENQIFYERTDYTTRWTKFDKDNGKILGFREKFSETSENSRDVFVGVFAIKDPVLLLKCLRKSKDTSSEISTFYSGLQKYLDRTDYSLVKSEKWIDVGHLDTYHEAKKDYLNSRNFNRLQVDKQKNTITKKSSDIEILKPEIEWYNLIPNDLKPYTPRIYRSKVENTSAEVEMDYVGYPSLSELYLHGSHSQHIWKKIYQEIFQMLKEFGNYSKEISKSEIEADLREMYYEKTLRRLEKVKNRKEFSTFFDQETIEINGNEMVSAKVIIQNLDNLLRKNNLLTSEEFSVIHGDLILSNILYGARAGIIRLVDPRGEFGNQKIYGDQTYDLAKLRHSVCGKYEFIINDMFEIEEESGVNYEVFANREHKKREKLFLNMLNSRFGENTRKIKAVESLLFLSMVPLHNDNTRRQKYMLTRGVELANQTLV